MSFVFEKKTTKEWIIAQTSSILLQITTTYRFSQTERYETNFEKYDSINSHSFQMGYSSVEFMRKLMCAWTENQNKFNVKNQYKECVCESLSACLTFYRSHNAMWLLNRYNDLRKVYSESKNQWNHFRT